MRQSQVQYLNPEVRTISVRNANSSAALLDGQPVFFDSPAVAASSFPGVDVKRASETGSSVGLFAGIIRTGKSAGLLAGEVGEAVVYGFMLDSVTYVVRTRAASTDSWSTVAAIGVGDQLAPETVNNYIYHVGTLALSAGLYPLAAAESKASIAGSATSTSNSSTVQTGSIKIFVRLM